jgi:hypothetical protein
MPLSWCHRQDENGLLANIFLGKAKPDSYSLGQQHLGKDHLNKKFHQKL